VNQSIEFDNAETDPNLPEIVRKNFRVPVENAQDVWVKIQDGRYDILDISPGGIRIPVEEQNRFVNGQVLPMCELHLFGLCLEHLTGRVIHVSPGDKHLWHCGIEWTGIDTDKTGRLVTVLSEMKNRLLEHGHIEGDV